MRAAVYESFRGQITIQNIPDPEPKSDGVVVKVLATGLCRSDWHGWMGHDSDIVLPHVPGHELAGTVAAIGKNIKNFNVGDRVTVPFVSGCGTCGECQTGNQHVCDYQSQPGFTHHGSFAEYVALDFADTNLVKLSDQIDNVTAATLGCRFITSFRAIVTQGKVSAGQFVVIHGCGGIGLSAIMIAKSLGAQVIAVDINPNALHLANQIGADKLINSKKSPDVIDLIRDITNGGAHVSIDALGSSETSINSISCLKKRGKHIQVGLMTGDHKSLEVPMDRILSNELELIGSHGMQAHKYPEMLQMITEGKLNPKMLINKTITLEEATTILPTMNKFDHSGVLVIDTF